MDRWTPAHHNETPQLRTNRDLNILELPGTPKAWYTVEIHDLARNRRLESQVLGSDHRR